MSAADRPVAAQIAEPDAQAHPQQHHNQRRGNDRLLQQLDLVPDNQQRHGRQTDDGSAGMDVAQEAQISENVFSLSCCWKANSPSVGVVTHEVRNLLQNQDDTDRGQQPFDHAGWKKRGDESRAREPSTI